MQVRVNRKSNSEFYGPPINQRVLEMLSVQSVQTRRDRSLCLVLFRRHFECIEDYVSLTFINTYLIPGVGWMSGGKCVKVSRHYYAEHEQHSHFLIMRTSDWVRVWPDKNQIAIIVP